MTDLDIIIPIYNEGIKIVKLIGEIEKRIKFKKKIFICYDNESDNSLEFIKSSKYTNLKYIKNPLKGPNTAILEGIKNTNSEFIVVYMADDFKNIDLLNDMVNIFKNKKVDLIVPSRFIIGGTFVGASFFKKYVTIIGSFLVNKIALLPVKDPTNAFKMFNKKTKNQIEFKSKKGFTFALELTTKSYLNRNKILEIPCIWEQDKDRKSNFKVLEWLPNYIYWLVYSLIKIYIFKLKKVGGLIIK